jgi:type I restriction enzyme S subunit
MTAPDIEQTGEKLSSGSRSLPTGWALAFLGDGLVFDVQPGFACGENNRDGQGVAHLRPMNVHEDGRIDLSIVKYVPESRADRDQRLLRQGDVIFNNTNSPELVGKTAYYYQADQKAFSNHMTRLRCRSEVLDPRFCAMELHHRWKEGYFRSVCSHHVSQSSVSRAVLLNTPIVLPPLPEQKRIVAKVEELLARVNAARERLARVQEIMKRFRQSVLAAACSGRLTTDWRDENLNVEPALDLVKKIRRAGQSAAQKRHKKTSDRKSLPFREAPDIHRPTETDIPNTWQLVLSQELFSFVTSGSRGWAKYYSEQGPLFLRIGNLDHGTISLKLNQVKRVNPPKGIEGTRTRVRSSDILISITADVGMIGVIPAGLQEAYINQHIALARPVDGFSIKYLAWYLASDAGLHQFQQLQRGATKIGLRLDDIRSIWVPFPPLDEQIEIVRRIEAFFKIADRIEERYQKGKFHLDKLTQSILAKAFRGELVPQDPNDEPASELLKRIKEERAETEPLRKTNKKKTGTKGVSRR